MVARWTRTGCCFAPATPMISRRSLARCFTSPTSGHAARGIPPVRSIEDDVRFARSLYQNIERRDRRARRAKFSRSPRALRLMSEDRRGGPELQDTGRNAARGQVAARIQAADRRPHRRRQRFQRRRERERRRSRRAEGRLVEDHLPPHRPQSRVLRRDERRHPRGARARRRPRAARQQRRHRPAGCGRAPGAVSRRGAPRRDRGPGGSGPIGTGPIASLGMSYTPSTRSHAASRHRPALVRAPNSRVPGRTRRRRRERLC